MLRLAVILMVLFLVSCGGGNSIEDEEQHLIIVSYSPGGTERMVTLKGPQSTRFPAVTYFLFGSDEDFGDTAGVPLLAQRLGEQAFGPFSFGEQQQVLDFSAWGAYGHVYLRAPGVKPNLIHKIKPGKIYEFSTN